MKNLGDVHSKTNSEKWFYSDIVKKHFFNPKNFIEGERAIKYKEDGIGVVGSPACGDMMKVWIKVDKIKDKIKDMKWQTFGCASALASTSMLSVMVCENGGMKIEKALKIKPKDIIKRLKGLPAIKVHCSVLGDKALQAAINNYFVKSKQTERIVGAHTNIIDHETGVTDEDIREAVLEGAWNLEQIQHKLKVGIVNKKCLPRVERLIRFYKEMYHSC
mgnify:CR=1 FL=1